MLGFGLCRIRVNRVTGSSRAVPTGLIIFQILHRDVCHEGGIGEMIVLIGVRLEAEVRGIHAQLS